MNTKHNCKVKRTYTKSGRDVDMRMRPLTPESCFKKSDQITAEALHKAEASSEKTSVMDSLGSNIQYYLEEVRKANTEVLRKILQRNIEEILHKDMGLNSYRSSLPKEITKLGEQRQRYIQAVGRGHRILSSDDVIFLYPTPRFPSLWLQDTVLLKLSTFNYD